MYRWTIACITQSNLILRTDVGTFKHSIHAVVQLQNPSIPYSPRLMNAAILGTDLPNPITWSKVGLITSSHASCPGKMRSSGLTAKQPKGSFWLPTGMDCGRFAVSAHNQERNAGGAISCTKLESDGPGSKALSREVTSRVGGSSRASMLITISVVWEEEVSWLGPSGEMVQDGCDLSEGAKKMVIVVVFFFFDSLTLLLWALLAWWPRRFESPLCIERQHISHQCCSMFCAQL